MSQKLVNGEIRCKAPILGKGSEERGKDMNTDALTCAPETLRVCMAKIAEMVSTIQSLDINDIKIAYLQVDEIKRTVYPRPPIEAKGGGYLWRLKMMVFEIKDAAWAWYERNTRVI